MEKNVWVGCRIPRDSAQLEEIEDICEKYNISRTQYVALLIGFGPDLFNLILKTINNPKTSFVEDRAGDRVLRVAPSLVGSEKLRGRLKT